MGRLGRTNSIVGRRNSQACLKPQPRRATAPGSGPDQDACAIGPLRTRRVGSSCLSTRAELSLGRTQAIAACCLGADSQSHPGATLLASTWEALSAGME